MANTHAATTSGRLPAIDCFPLGPFETNCYVVRPAAGEAGACVVIDPGFGPEEVIDHLRAHRLRPDAILLTHAHADHIAGIPDLLRAFPGTPIRIHTAEAGWLADPVLNLSAGMGMDVSVPGPDGALEPGGEIGIGMDRWAVLHTPGHSPGSVTLYHAPSATAIVGDTLFAGSVGRSDFPGSDPGVLAASIRGVLYALPAATRVLPGHGPATTIDRERRTNPFVRA